jgi:putative sigma-54 modulation protein
MLINVSGQHVTVTPALKAYVEEKLRKLERHFDHITNVHVALSIEKKIHNKARAEVHSPGAVVVAEADSTDMYASIDALSHKLNEQIIKHKDKMKDHHPSRYAVNLTEDQSELE